jgi:hypothetical protein
MDDPRLPDAGRSLVRGLTDQPLSLLTVDQLLRRAVAQAPGAEAAVFVE